MLGTGNMARMHVRNFLKHAETELVALCARTEASANDFLNTVELPAAPAVYTDFDRMLAETAGLDVLFVCLPPFAHEGQVVQAAEKGLHLFLEKPIALSEADAEAMASAIERAGITSQVCYQFRFRKATQRMLALLRSGEAGRPTLYEGRFWVNMLAKPWWQNFQMSGGQLFEQLIHLYDLGMAFCGPVREVSARVANLTHTDQPDYTIEDTSLGQLLFENGALGNISGTNSAIRERYIGDYRLVCENVTLQTRSSGDWREADRATLHFAPEQVEEIVEDADAHSATMDDFVNALRAGGPTQAPARTGLESVRLTRRALESAAQGGAPLKI